MIHVSQCPLAITVHRICQISNAYLKENHLYLFLENTSFSRDSHNT